MSCLMATGASVTVNTSAQTATNATNSMHCVRALGASVTEAKKSLWLAERARSSTIMQNSDSEPPEPMNPASQQHCQSTDKPDIAVVLPMREQVMGGRAGAVALNVAEYGQASVFRERLLLVIGGT